MTSLAQPKGTVRGAILIFTAFAVLTVLTHFGSIEQEIINWDEPTFLVMADDVLRGHLPYVHYTDNKPPGLFLIIAAWTGVFGKTLWAVRALGQFAILVTALSVFGICRRFSSLLVASLATGVYIATMALPYGLWTSSEVIATAFLLSGAWLLVCGPQSLAAAAGVGLLVSCATLVRLNMAYAVICLGIYYAISLWRPHGPRLSVLAYGIGGLLPLAGILLAFLAQGKLGLALISMFEMPAAYAGQAGGQTGGPIDSAFLLIRFWGAFTIRDYQWEYLPLTVLLIASVWPVASALRGARVSNPNSIAFDRRGAILLVCLGLAVLLSMMLGGPFYDHYLVQILPFAAILVAIGVGNLRRSAQRISLALCALIVVVALVRSAPSLVRTIANPEYLAQRHGVGLAAERILKDRAPNDRVWAISKVLLYWQLGDPPLQYAVHPDLSHNPAVATPLAKAEELREGKLFQVTEVTAENVGRKEFFAILESRPAYLETPDPGALYWLAPDERAALSSVLSSDYAKWVEYPGMITVYKRTGPITRPTIE